MCLLRTTERTWGLGRVVWRRGTSDEYCQQMEDVSQREMLGRKLCYAEEASRLLDEGADWKTGCHPDARWLRRRDLILALVGSKLRPMARDIAVAKQKQEQADKYVPLDPVDRSTPEENWNFLLSEVFGHEGIVRLIAQFVPPGAEYQLAPLCTRLYVRPRDSSPYNSRMALSWSSWQERVTGDGTLFELLEDPKTTQRAVIIGMFVVRPLSIACSLESSEHKGALQKLIGEEYDWVYNVNAPGLAGGGVISNGNAFDGYRLAVQYGLSDAVLVSSKTASLEGTGEGGYVWVSSNPCSWPHVKARFGDELHAAIAATRKEWQDAGALSRNRQCPAQIVLTHSGERHEGSADFLDARVFLEEEQLGLECYILTSALGRDVVCARASSKGWSPERIDRTVLVCSRADSPATIDLQEVPSFLFARLDVRVANHDGGAAALREFAAAGALTQLHLSLGLNSCLKQSSRVAPLCAAGLAEGEGEGLFSFFFSSSSSGAGQAKGFPAGLASRVETLLVDTQRDMCVCVIDTRRRSGEEGNAVLLHH